MANLDLASGPHGPRNNVVAILLATDMGYTTVEHLESLRELGADVWRKVDVHGLTAGQAAGRLSYAWMWGVIAFRPPIGTRLHDAAHKGPVYVARAQEKGQRIRRAVAALAGRPVRTSAVVV